MDSPTDPSGTASRGPGLSATQGQGAVAAGGLDNLRKRIMNDPKSFLQPSFFDVEADTIASLGVLDVLLEPTFLSSSSDRGLILDKTQVFLNSFRQDVIRLRGDQFVRLLNRVGSGALFAPTMTVQLIATAIQRLDPTGTMFTSSHCLLARLVRQTGCAEPALPVFNSDITAYPCGATLHDKSAILNLNTPPSQYISHATGLTERIKANMVLEYNYTLGEIYVSLSDWRRARLAFERALTHPQKERGTVKTMTDAYKKWLLVGLLETGKSPALPSYTTGSAKGTYLSQAAYRAIATAFDENNATQLQVDANTNVAAYEEDGNTALVGSVLQAFQKWQILNLRKVYSRVQVSKIRQSTLSAETGEQLPDDAAVMALIRDMMETKMTSAAFETAEDGQIYVTFEDESRPMPETDFAKEVAQRHFNIKRLTKEYEDVNERFSGNKEYVKHVWKEQKRASLADSDGEPGGRMGFDAVAEDEEDLMTGVMANG